MKPRIILADQHSLVLEALSAVLRAELDVLAVSTSGRAAVSAALELRPDLVLVELELPALSGLEVVRTLRKSLPEVRTVVVTGSRDPGRARAAMDAGARGYVLKQDSVAELLAGVQHVQRGETFISASLRTFLGRPARRSGSREPRALTPRQTEILARVAAGMSGKVIADDLGIALKTVEYHKALIARRLGLRSIAAMTRYAVEHELVGSRRRD